METPKASLVYRDPNRAKILWIGIGVALLVLVCIYFAVISLSTTMYSSGAFTGKIIAKEFTPEPAREITIGRGGLQSSEIQGEYLLKVQTPDGSRVFNVWVDRTVYEEFNVGDDYYVIPTP